MQIDAASRSARLVSELEKTEVSREEVKMKDDEAFLGSADLPPPARLKHVGDLLHSRKQGSDVWLGCQI